MKKNLLIIVLLGISSGLMAQNTDWDPASFPNSQGLWINPGNWTNGFPGEAGAEQVRFNKEVTMDCIVDEDVTDDVPTLPVIAQGQDGPGGTLIIKDGGVLTLGSQRWSGIGWTHPAKLIVEEGGEITFGSHMWIGFHAGSEGTEVHLEGGTINVNQMFGMDFEKNGAASTFYLKDGLLNLANIHNAGQSMGANAKIEYTGGLMQIRGDHKTTLETHYVDKIIGDYEIWVEPVINGTDTTYITKLSNKGPVDEGTTVVDIILESTDHTTLAAALTAADLVGTLQGDGPFTVFAPTNDAFAALPAGLLDDLLADPSGDLTDILLYHVVGALAMSTDLTDGQEVTTLLGQDVVVTITNGTVKINDAEVTIADLAADNGVVHVIDVVLVPEADDVSVGDISLHDINIYPNPASSQLYISHGVKIDRVEIYNITGSRVLSQENIATEAIDISELNSGLYFISVIDVNNNNIVRKFIKQ